MIGPASSSGSTKCDGAAVDFDAGREARGRACRGRERPAAAEGWILMYPTAPWGRRTGALKSRMKPARQINLDAVNVEQGLHRTLEFVATGIDFSGRPRRRRRHGVLGEGRDPAASGRLERTRAISAGKLRRPRRCDQGPAMLEPRPEIRIAVRLRRTSKREPPANARVAAAADESGRCGPAPGAARAASRPRAPPRRDKGDHADPAVEGTQHFGLARARRPGEPAEDRAAAGRRKVERDAETSGSTRGRFRESRRR